MAHGGVVSGIAGIAVKLATLNNAEKLFLLFLYL